MIKSPTKRLMNNLWTLIILAELQEARILELITKSLSSGLLKRKFDEKAVEKPTTQFELSSSTLIFTEASESDPLNSAVRIEEFRFEEIKQMLLSSCFPSTKFSMMSLPSILLRQL